MTDATLPKSARFWNRIAKRYAKTPVADASSYQHKLDATRALLHHDMRVLEFGCGTGTTAIHHAPHVRHLTAIDISARMIAIARQKATEAGTTNLDFEVAQLSDQLRTEQRYDMIMGHSILHLVEDRDATLRAVHTLLKPGGYLVASTACIADIMPLLRLIAGPGRAIGLLPVIRIFTRGQLESSIRAAGFDLRTAWQPGPKKAVFHIVQKSQ